MPSAPHRSAQARPIYSPWSEASQLQLAPANRRLLRVACPKKLGLGSPTGTADRIIPNRCNLLGEGDSPRFSTSRAVCGTPI